MTQHPPDKPLFWIGSSWRDLKDSPAEVQNFIGYALHWAQRGGKSPDAKPLQGFGGANVLEIVDDFDGSCSRSHLSEPVRAIIGGFLLGFRDSIFSAVLTLFATERTVVWLCSQTSGVCSQ